MKKAKPANPPPFLLIFLFSRKLLLSIQMVIFPSPNTHCLTKGLCSSITLSVSSQNYSVLLPLQPSYCMGNKCWQTFMEMMQFIAILAYCCKLYNLSGHVLYRVAHSGVSIICKLQLLLHIWFYVKCFSLWVNLAMFLQCRVHVP